MQITVSTIAKHPESGDCTIAAKGDPLPNGNRPLTTVMPELVDIDAAGIGPAGADDRETRSG